jgi:hypothetical protein
VRRVQAYACTGRLQIEAVFDVRDVAAHLALQTRDLISHYAKLLQDAVLEMVRHGLFFPLMYRA